MIGGVNDADADADRLARLARRLGALVNILPLHPGGAPDLTPTTGERIRAFAARLRNQGIEATVRRSRGLDIDAACGQLRVKTERKRKARWRRRSHPERQRRGHDGSCPLHCAEGDSRVSAPTPSPRTPPRCS